jgi:hypothetical protein
MTSERAGEIAFLRDRLQQEIKLFHARRAEHRTKAFRLKMGTVVLGALTSVLVGVNASIVGKAADAGHWTAVLSAAALCTSATVPVFAAWEAFFDHRWLWIQYTASLETLYSLSDELEFSLSGGGTIDQKKINELFVRFEAALQSTDSKWQNKRLEELAAAEKQDGAFSSQSK